MNEEENQVTAHEESHANAEVDERQLFNPVEDERSEVHIGADSNDDSVITWEASEYIHHQKSLSWYLRLTGIAIVLGLISYFVVGDFWSLLLILVMYLTIAIYAKREPRVLRYSVSHEGVTIGERHFGYDQFSSFSVMQDTGVPSVTFAPARRFMPSVSVYFAPSDADSIVEELAKFLPHEQKNPGYIDRAMLKLRF